MPLNLVLQCLKNSRRDFRFNICKTQNNRIIIGTYSSNVDRVQQILDIATRYERKVAIDGRSMKNTLSIASDLGYVTITEKH